MRTTELDPRHGLFVERWMELFRRDVPIYFRAQTMSSRTLEEELRLCANRPVDNKMHWSHQRFHRFLVQAEADFIERLPLLREIALEPDPNLAAERLARRALLQGHHPEHLFNMYRWVLEASENSGKSIDPVLLLGRWLVANRRSRPIEVYISCDRRGTDFGGTIEIQQYEDVPPDIREQIELLWLDYSRVTLPRFLIRMELDEVDVHAAHQAARRSLENRLRRRDSGRISPRLTERGPFASKDQNEQPEPRIVAFKPSRDYRYRIVKPVPTHLMGHFTRAASSDRTIEVSLDHLLDAWRDLEHRDDPQTAFARLVPLLDSTFSDCDSVSDRGFNRSATILAAVLAVSYFRAHLQYIRELMCNSRPGLRSLVPRRISDSDLYDILLDEEYWRKVAQDEHRRLVSCRRAVWFTELTDPGAVAASRFERNKWSTARAIRARHQFAHHGDSLGDLHLLAVLLEALTVSLRYRVWAQETGRKASEVFGNAVKACTDPSVHSFDHRALSVDGYMGSDRWLANAAAGVEARGAQQAEKRRRAEDGHSP